MNKFKTNNIPTGAEIIAQSLVAARQEKNISLKEASKRTQINKRYLEALESGSFDRLPSGLYGKNFLKEYAGYLEIDSSELLALMNPGDSKKDPEKIKDLFTEKAPSRFRFLSIPKILKNTAIVAIVLVLAIYLGAYLKNIISPPMLDVISPAINTVTNNISINVEGYTEPEAEVTINGLSVLLNAQGFFSKKISLKNGINTIMVSSQKKYSRKNNIIKKILVNSS